MKKKAASKPSPKIERVGRLCYLVRSHSREGLRHYVDLEPELDDNGKPQRFGEPAKCSCEAFDLLVHRPCRHIREVVEFILDALGFDGQDLILAEDKQSHGMIPTQDVRYMLGKQSGPKQDAPAEKEKKREYTLKPRSSIQSKGTT